jgi:hypothetical protein
VRLARADVMVLAFVASCGTGGPGLRSKDAAALPDTAILMKTYHGNGFRASYPWEGRIDTVAPNREHGREIAIVGEDIHVIAAKWPHSEDTVGRSAPAYNITIEELTNAARRTLRQVVDSIIRPPPSKDSDHDAPRLDSLRVNGERGYILDISCCDCESHQAYFERAGRIIRLAWSTDDNDVFAGVSRPLFWFVVTTFRWE